MSPSIFRLCSLSVLMLVMCLLSACGPRFTKRYTAVVSPDSFVAGDAVEAVQNSVAFSVFVTDPPAASAPQSLVSLTAEGQAAYIDLVKKKMPNASLEEVRAILAGGINPAGPRTNFETHTRSIVMTLVHDRVAGADRIEQADVLLCLHGVGNPRFVKWSRMESETESIDLGELTFSSKTSVSGGIEITPASPRVSTIDFGASNETTVGETVALREMRTKFLPILQSNSARIIQTSVPGVDLTGNTIVVFTVENEANPSGARKTDPDCDPIVTDETRSGDRYQLLLDPEVLKFSVAGGRLALRFLSLRVSDSAGPIQLSYRLVATVRHVLQGKRTLTESDDVVSFVDVEKSSGDNFIEVVSGDEITKEVHCIHATVLGSSDRAVLRVQRPDRDRPQTLLFESKGEADGFIRWYQTSNEPNTMGPANEYGLSWSGNADKKKLGKLRVDRVSWQDVRRRQKLCMT